MKFNEANSDEAFIDKMLANDVDEGKILFEIEKRLGVTTSDAQGILSVHQHESLHERVKHLHEAVVNKEDISLGTAGGAVGTLLPGAGKKKEGIVRGVEEPEEGQNALGDVPPREDGEQMVDLGSTGRKSYRRFRNKSHFTCSRRVKNIYEKMFAGNPVYRSPKNIQAEFLKLRERLKENIIRLENRVDEAHFKGKHDQKVVKLQEKLMKLHKEMSILSESFLEAGSAYTAMEIARELRMEKIEAVAKKDRVYFPQSSKGKVVEWVRKREGATPIVQEERIKVKLEGTTYAFAFKRGHAPSDVWNKLTEGFGKITGDTAVAEKAAGWAWYKYMPKKGINENALTEAFFKEAAHAMKLKNWKETITRLHKETAEPDVVDDVVDDNKNVNNPMSPGEPKIQLPGVGVQKEGASYTSAKDNGLNMRKLFDAVIGGEVDEASDEKWFRQKPSFGQVADVEVGDRGQSALRLKDGGFVVVSKTVKDSDIDKYRENTSRSRISKMHESVMKEGEKLHGVTVRDKKTNKVIAFTKASGPDALKALRYYRTQMDSSRFKAQEELVDADEVKGVGAFG